MRRLNKKGLSGIVTTVLLIMLVFIAIGAVWVVVGNLIEKSSEGISLDLLTLDLEIVSAKINFSNGVATVRVKRNVGGGDIVGIKFIVEDNFGTDIFEEKFGSFQELEERTFTLDLTQSEFLTLYEIHKISIASIYSSTSGTTELTGSISDSVEGLNSELDSLGGTEEGEEIDYCTNDAGCPDDTPVANTEVCNNELTQVIQAVTTWSCLTEAATCINEVESQVKTTCLPEEYCFDGECVPDEVGCTNETVAIDCGVDRLVGYLYCSESIKENVLQDYRTYTCNEGLCQSSSAEQLIEDCSIENPGYQCVNGACVDTPECTSDGDCEIPEFCNDLGVCELEVALNTGVVGSIWPFNIGEYFDSVDLPTQSEDGDYNNHFIIFPQSDEDGCLFLTEHVYPEETGNAYVRIGATKTNITSGINYEIWKRDYICSQTSYYL